MVEETYETLEAIDSGDAEKLCEELGDFLLQALMHAQMDAIEGLYDIDDVVRGICDKLIRRHPHVFGDVKTEDADEVLKNWDAIKQQEKGAQEPQSILAGVPKSLPSLLRAYETSKRAVRVGFEWGSLDEVFAKLEEERAELREATQSGDVARIESEIGDLLFTIVNIARWLRVEPEEALRKMVNRFTLRFQYMENEADKPLRELSFDEWDTLWNLAKASTSAE
jgi:tetrapyrrole methylase family protein/MazG family protein